MRLSRVIIIVLAVAAGLLFLFAYLRPNLGLPQPAGLPIDLQTVIPTSWKVIPGQFRTCDFDNDGEDEYLIIYSYDLADGTGQGLIGGAIYDMQVNRVPQAPGVEAPYRPAFLTPYKLLPDIYGGKGQGYLGQSSVAVYTLPPTPVNTRCQAKEILIYGYSHTKWPTTLSVFRWEGEIIGYVGWHVLGNARVVAYDAADAVSSGQTPVINVYAYNQLGHRSLLCAVRHYQRTKPTDKEDLPPGLDFAEVKEDYTLDFCYGAPKDPAYPEGVVVALLRGQRPPAGTPTGESYLMETARNALPAGLAELATVKKDRPIRILSVSAPGTLGWYPPQGSRFTWTPAGGTPGPTPQVWWINYEPPTTVETEIVLNDNTGQIRRVVWTLVSMASEKANADTIWRISRVELR